MLKTAQSSKKYKIDDIDKIFQNFPIKSIFQTKTHLFAK